MDTNHLDTYDLAVEELLTNHTRTFGELQDTLDELTSLFEEHIEPGEDLARTERFLYLHQVYDLLPAERIEAMLEEIARVDTNSEEEEDFRRMCEAWIQQWCGRTARVREILEEMHDARQNPQIWMQLIGAIGHAGDVDALRRERDAFCEVHANDRALKTYCDCVYVGFSMHLGVQDTRLDLWELEISAYELPIVSRTSANAFLAVYYRNLGMPDHAWRLDLESLKLAEWFGHPRTLAAILLDTATSEMAMGYLESAYDKLLTCRGLLEQTQLPYILGRSYLEEARALLALGHYAECARVAEDAMHLVRELGHENSATIAELLMIFGEFLSGRFDDARAHLDAVLSGDIPSDMTRWQGLAIRVFFLWHCEGEEVAQEALEAFSNDLPDNPKEFWLPVITWIREHMLDLELTEVEREDAREEPLKARLEWRAALRRLGGEAIEIDFDLLRRSMTGSFLAGLIELRDADEAMREQLELDITSRSFTLNDETNSLRRRSSLWKILLALSRASPAAISVDDLFEIGWPGEGLVDPIFASRRVYWAVGELRRLGLYKLIVTMEPGYALAASVSATEVTT